MELFVSFSEIMEYFKRHLRTFIIVVAAVGLVSGLLPLRFVHPQYAASTTIVISCQIPENAQTDYRLQYTSILNSRVQTAIAMASGSDIVTQTANKLGMKEDKITSISGTQVGTAPAVKLSVSTPDADRAAAIADTAAQVISEKLTQSFPSPQITAVISDKAIPQKVQSMKSTMVKAGLIGLIIGFIFYLCFGIVVVLMDKTIRNSHFVSEALKTNLLGQIPHKGNEEKLLDSFRKLRAAAVHQANGGKSFLVADVCENDGASAVSVGFASAIARSGKKVLLIDANLRTNGIVKNLGVNTEKNFYDVLCGSCSASQAICGTPVEGLSLIAGTEGGEGLADLLASEQLSRLLKELESQFDEIVINAPSEARFSDADNLARLTSSVIMVAKYASTPYQEFQDSFRRLRTAGGNVIGFITTEV